jgi:hypothetical protein
MCGQARCAVVQELLHKEVLGLDDLDRILGKRPYVTHELRNVDRFRGELEKTVRQWLPSGGGVWAWIESFRSPGLQIALDGAGATAPPGAGAEDGDDDEPPGGGGRAQEGEAAEEFSGWWADEAAQSSNEGAVKRKYPVAT